MTRSIRLLALLGLFTVFLSGCAVNRATSSVDPSARLAELKTMYIKKIPDDNSGTYELIADKLRSKGVTVSGGAGAPPGNVDAVVTYVDHWMWDLKMYMLELSITIRDPQTDLPLATGNSYHTLLKGLSPRQMVNEVIDNIYQGAK